MFLLDEETGRARVRGGHRGGGGRRWSARDSRPAQASPAGCSSPDSRSYWTTSRADPRFAAETAESTGYVPKALMAVPLLSGNGRSGCWRCSTGPRASGSPSRSRTCSACSRPRRRSRSTCSAARAARAALLVRGRAARGPLSPGSPPHSRRSRAGRPEGGAWTLLAGARAPRLSGSDEAPGGAAGPPPPGARPYGRLACLCASTCASSDVSSSGSFTPSPETLCRCASTSGVVVSSLVTTHLVKALPTASRGLAHPFPWELLLVGMGIPTRR